MSAKFTDAALQRLIEWVIEQGGEVRTLEARKMLVREGLVSGGGRPGRASEIVYAMFATSGAFTKAESKGRYRARTEETPESTEAR